MPKSKLLAPAAAALALVGLGGAGASAHAPHGCPPGAYPEAAPAYVARYHGTAGYGHGASRRWHSPAYRSGKTEVVYEPPYAHYSRPHGARAHYRARPGSRWRGACRWLER